MPGTNDFLSFAGGTGANVVSQATYAALTSTLANGFSSGVADSTKLNKVWRQSAIMSAVLAQFIVDETGANATDDGTTATLLSSLKDATLSLVERTTSTVGGTVDAITATYTRPPTAFKNGVSYFVRSSGANTAVIPTFTPASGVLAAKPIVKFGNIALVAGDIGIAGHWLELMYDATLDKWQLQNPVISFTAPNLTGHITSVGTATVLGSFSTAQLNTALNDADVATGGGTATGSNTGDQTNISGNAATASSVPWTGITGKPDVATGGGTATGSNTGDQTNISGNAATASSVPWAGITGKPASAAPARYVSSLIAFPAANVITSVAHGLGAVPFYYSVRFVCVAADTGYSIGDQVEMTSQHDGDGARRQASFANTTTLGFTSINSGPFLPGIDGTGALTGNASNWNLLFLASL